MKTIISRPLGSDELRRAAYKSTGQDSGRRDLLDMDFLLDTIPGAALVYKITPHGLEILTCTRGLTSITGWDAEEFCQRVKDHNIKMMHPADEIAFQRMIERIIKTRSVGELVYRGYKKDGSEVWLWFQGQYAGEEDKCPLVEGLILDVSNNSNMYQTILDESTSLITVVDEHSFEVLYANKAVRDYVRRVNSEEYIGSVCYKHIFGLDAPCSFCISNCSKDDYYLNPNVEFQKHKFRQIFKKMKWHGKDAILEFTIDTTEERAALDMIEKQKEQQDAILDTIPAGIMVFRFDQDGVHIVSVNKSIVGMMELDRHRALGEAARNITLLTHPDDLPLVLEAARKLGVAGSYVEYEYRHFIRSRNEYIWVLGQGRSISGADGCVYAYVNYTDITARKEVKNLQGKLETAGVEAATKAEFYSQMSHDMRTPMNGILGIAELAAQEDDVEKLHRDIEKIRQSGHYMLNLINDTLDLQRMETGRMKLEPAIVRCQAMLEEVVGMMMPAIREKNLTLNVKVLDNSEMDWYVRVDALRIKQIASNIISNSVKYTPTGGTIEICVGELKRDTEKMISRTLIQITDNGVGMSKDFLEHGIFKPFSQERNQMSMQYPGSGLGLSIVKKLVELMGGSIQVESTLGVGTVFHICLDMEMVTDEEAQKLLKAAAAENRTSEEIIAGRRVLLCEDHPLNAEITQRLLAKVGCAVEWAENGAIGVELFRKSAPGYFDAVLMDIRMPVMDGLEATRAIRRLSRADAATIPVIAMTANAYEADILNCMNAGMNAYLAKPVDPQQLYKTLHDSIQGIRQLH